jgi:hypothetical protein
MVTRPNAIFARRGGVELERFRERLLSGDYLSNLNVSI